MQMDLYNKTVLITGATSGIGLALAHQLVKSGAVVLGVGRSDTRNQKTEEDILQAYPQAQVKFFLADLSSQAAIRCVSEKISRYLSKNHNSKLDVLVNNAGLYLEKKRKSVDGIEVTFAVNHLAPFLLTHQMLPFLLESPTARVLTISSFAHFNAPFSLRFIEDPWLYVGLIAYKRSKLSNVLFTVELNRRYPGLQAFAVNPGLVNTDIASKGSQGISHWVWRRKRENGITTEKSAKGILCLIKKTDFGDSNGVYYENCEPNVPSRQARDSVLAKNLWEKSCQLTGLEW